MPKQKEHDLRILQWNVRRLESKKPIILKALDVIKPDVLCLQETNGKNYRNFNLTRYKYVARKDRVMSTGGGVAIFAKRELATTELKQWLSKSMWERKYIKYVPYIYLLTLTTI